MISDRIRFSLAASVVSLFTVPAAGAADAKIKIVTTIPDLAWSAREIGGDRVEVSALLKGTENPHYVDAVPEFILRVADADIVCMVGLDLEVGYMPPVLSRSGNAAVQPGGKGYCNTGSTVPVLEKPSGPVDRSMGDIHPGGNPHFYLSPAALAAASETVAAALTVRDPDNADAYKTRQQALQTQLHAIGAEARQILAPVLARQTKPLIIEYHKEFAYYFDYYGLKSFGSIEEKPGVPPSAGRLGEIALAARAAGVAMVLATDYAPAKTLQRFSELSGIPVVTVPTMVQPDGQQKTYADLQRFLATAIASTIR
jgi:zinc/manganese transport system substrate-binding protein